jgi:hypothetical protein
MTERFAMALGLSDASSAANGTKRHPDASDDRCPIAAQTHEAAFVEGSAEAPQPPSICRGNVHSSPLDDTSLPTAGAVWGTRGPEFKSRRPDHQKAPHACGLFRSKPQSFARGMMLQ